MLMPSQKLVVLNIIHLSLCDSYMIAAVLLVARNESPSNSSRLSSRSIKGYVKRIFYDYYYFLATKPYSYKTSCQKWRSINPSFCREKISIVSSPQKL